MSKLSEIETSVAKLHEDDFAKFRQWFWEDENEKWGKQIEKDIAEKKLDGLTAKAIADFKKGNFKSL